MQQEINSSNIYFSKNEDGGKILSIWIKKEDCIEYKNFIDNSEKKYSFDSNDIPREVSEYFGIVFKNDIRKVIEEGNNIKIMLESKNSSDIKKTSNSIKEKIKQLKEMRERKKELSPVVPVVPVVDKKEEENKKRKIETISVDTNFDESEDRVNSNMSGSLSSKRINFSSPKNTSTPKNTLISKDFSSNEIVPTPEKNMYKENNSSQKDFSKKNVNNEKSCNKYKIEENNSKKFYYKYNSYEDYINSISQNTKRIGNFEGYYNENDFIKSCSFCKNYFNDNTQKKKDNNHMLCRCDFMCTKKDCLNDDIHSIGECKVRDRNYLDYEKLSVTSFLQKNTKINFERIKY